jgi:phage-related protein
MYGTVLLPVVKKLPSHFYRTGAGNEPVREWLKSLPQEDRRVLGRAIAIIEFGWPIGMPVCRTLGDGLWEVRSDLSGNRTARVLFCVAQRRLVLLHGFVKKTRTTPKPDLELARLRQREVKG